MRQLFGLALLLSLALDAHAQTGKTPWQEFDKRLTASQKVSPLGNNAFGDQVSLSNGALSFSATDVSIPGNSGLPVAFGRTYTVRNWRYRTTPGMMADWDVDVPSISGVYLQAHGWVGPGGTVSRCSVAGPPPATIPGVALTDFWQGANLNIPGVGGGELLSTQAGAAVPTSGGPFRWMTNEQIHVSCLPTIKNGTGEGFLAITPDGTKYWFDWVGVEHEPPVRHSNGVLFTLHGMSPLHTATPLRRHSLYATRVEDRFGNVVTYTYSNTAANPGRLTSIAGNDGRQITVAYNGNGHVASVSDGSRTWSYSYASAAAGRRTLTAVTLPDTSAWAINFAAFTNAEILQTEVFMAGEIYRGCHWNELPLNFTLQPAGTLSHPAGATGTFTLFMAEHGRSNVPLTCNNVTLGSGGNNTNDDTPFYPLSSYSFTLKSKAVSGPGLGTAQWDYQYAPGISFHLYPGTTLERPVCTLGAAACAQPPCTSAACAGGSTTTVTGPNSERTTYTYGNTYRYDEGKLKRVDVGTVANPLMRTTASSYDLSLVNQAYLARWGLGHRGNGDSFPAEYHRPLLGTTIIQQGISFSRTVTGFDHLARPTSETQSSTLPPVPGAAPNTRAASTVYRDNTASWVIGQVAERHLAGTLMERTTFHGNDLPWQLYGPGNAIVQTLTYNADGTIATATDANNRTTTVSNWYRGIPRNVQFADGTGMSATVTALGWVDSVTDPNGFVKTFGYNAMGRVTQVTQPTGDTVAWAPTTIAFTKVAAAEYGIAAGHWRETVTTGNARKETYFDALWRPLLVREYDTASVAGTSRFTVQGFDHEGRPSFSAYPLASLGGIVNATLGVWTQYDALGRPTSVGQDSEHGLLVSQTNYLPGFQTQSVNPRGFATTLQFQAFDTPDTSAPVQVLAPEGQRTTLVRGALGRTLSMTRDGTQAGQLGAATRHYVYDPQLRLCKTIEPETGATVMQYDAAGNLIWSAAGLTLPDASQGACTNDRIAANSSGRRVDRTYDTRNRLSTLAFPDGRGNQAWAYTPDGLPSQITTNNAAGSLQVINTYTYNRRRLLTAETSGQPGWYTWGINYGYDANGSLASHTYPTGLVVAYAPNALGQATQAGSWATGVQYHPNGAVKQFSYGNGLTRSLTQNARQLPLTSADSGGALNQTYYYDHNGNVSHVADGLDSVRSRWMAYDGLDRLTDAGAVMFGGDHWHRFTYDAVDNLRSWKLAGVKDLANYIYDGSNRLASIQNTGGATVHSFNYDPQGNLSNKNSVGHDFDYGNRLREVPGIEHYRYDGHGRRVLVWRPVGGSTLSMYSQSGQVMYQHAEPKGHASEHIYLAGSLVASREWNWATAQVSTKYQHTDALGSPIAMSNEAGTVIDRTNYDPYGGAINKTIDGIGYTGHVMDPLTGLTNMQQRYFDAGVGRFASVDPVTASSVNGSNFNRYWYANNNPYRFTDPDGRWAEDLVIGIPSIVLGVQSLKANISAGNYWSAALDTVGVVVDAAAIAAPGVPGGAGLAIKGGRALDSMGDAGTAARAADDFHLPGDVPDSYSVVRGGTAEMPANGEVFSGSYGQTVADAAQGVPHGTVRASTAGDIRAAGGRVDVAPERTRSGQMNGQHANVTEGGSQTSFGNQQPNPVPKDDRIK